MQKPLQQKLEKKQRNCTQYLLQSTRLPKDKAQLKSWFQDHCVTFWSNLREKCAICLLLWAKKNDDYLFVTNDTGEMMTRVDSAVGIFRKEVGCVNIMTAKSFRQYFATKAQNSDDPITRERMPIHMGHSQNTVQTYYLRRPERCRSMYKCLKKLVA